MHLGRFAEEEEEEIASTIYRFIESVVLSSTVLPDKRERGSSNENVRVSGSSKDREASLPDKRVAGKVGDYTS